MNSPFEYITIVIITACVVTLFTAIFIDFYLFNEKQGIKREKRSVVATGSMVAFYLVYYVLLKFGVGKWSPIPDALLRIQIIIGVLMVVSGTIVNIVGRVQLKGNWANHIKIYENHSLITKGVYAYVRHPLYASIILMLYGGSIIYSNWLSAILVSIVFVPAMVYRAKQEEQLLLNAFPEYAEYQKRVGLFFPKQLRGYQYERV